jgi:cytochrome c oxidase subunit 2
MIRVRKTIRALILPLLALAAGLNAVPAMAQAPAAAVPAVAETSTAPAPVSTPAAPAKAPDIVHVAPTPGIGQPTESLRLQPQMTPIGEEAVRFHDYILVPMMFIMCIFVLLLLIWVVIRYRAAANPTPSRTSHNTIIEVIWTLFPVLVLVSIAVPSIRLLAHQYNPPKADLTVKVIGNQWYWTYQYPDNGDFEVVSNILKEKSEVKPGARFRTDADGPRLLAVDERMVVPAGAVVKIITTSNDVIHSFAMPAFWVKMDAIPGRLNETWFKVDRPGVYFGQCSELCGARHAYMPIAVEVVSKAQYAQWVASKGGTMPGAKPAANPDATSPASPATAAPAAPLPAPATGPTENVTTAAPAPTSQPATAQN